MTAVSLALRIRFFFVRSRADSWHGSCELVADIQSVPLGVGRVCSHLLFVVIPCRLIVQTTPEQDIVWYVYLVNVWHVSLEYKVAQVHLQVGFPMFDERYLHKRSSDDSSPCCPATECDANLGSALYFMVFSCSYMLPVPPLPSAPVCAIV